jgi:serine phosphatase RsbU (regulator of sigma subunit)
MGQLRNAVRAYAHETPVADQIVSRVNRMLCRLQPNELASMIVAVWDPLTGMLNRCAAGHPPLLRCREGETEFLVSSPGLLLGTDADYRYSSTEKVLRSGTTIVFYSDGLIESRRQGLTEGMAALRDKADSMRELDPQGICDELMGWRLADRSLDDDMCVLAARLG